MYRTLSREKVMARSLVVSFGVLISLAAGACGPARSSHEQSPEGAAAVVRAVIEEQAAAWNRGDIEGFMDGYARSEETVFVSGDTVTRGWQTVLDRYRKNYDSREKMGTLQFTELETKPLGPDAVVVLGRFQLTRAGDTPRGRFTLIFRRAGRNWRIVHDHTSSAS